MYRETVPSTVPEGTMQLSNNEGSAPTPEPKQAARASAMIEALGSQPLAPIVTYPCEYSAEEERQQQLNSPTLVSKQAPTCYI